MSIGRNYFFVNFRIFFGRLSVYLYKRTYVRNLLGKMKITRYGVFHHDQSISRAAVKSIENIKLFTRKNGADTCLLRFSSPGELYFQVQQIGK